MLIKRISLVGMLLFSSIWSIQCTREVGNESKVRLAIPNSTLSGTDSLVHIIVNVHGQGLSGPIKWDWDGHCHGAGCPADGILPPPPELSLIVPSGTGRLIQYLGVYRNSQSGNMSFHYGFANADLNPGVNVIDIYTSNLGSSSGVETTVAGRYLNAAGVVDTGRISAFIQPPFAGHPPMAVVQEEIFGGWVKLFFVPGVEFRFFLEPQMIEIFQGASPSSSDFVAGLNRLHIAKPAHFREFGDSNNPEYEEAPAENLIIGYFGPGAPSVNRVCYDPTTAYGSTEEIERLFLTPDNSTPIKWYGSATTPPTNSVHPISGGSTGGGVCANSSSLYVDHLDLDLNALANGKDGVGGFRGPFVYSSSGDPVSTSLDSNTDVLTADWQYLPGAFDGLHPLSGVEIWLKGAAYPPTGSPGMFGGDVYDLPCNQFFMAQGFVKHSDLNGQSNSFTLNNVYSLSDVDVGVCPFRNEIGFRTYFKASIRSYNEYYSGGGGGCSNCSGGGVHIDGPMITDFGPTQIGNYQTRTLVVRNELSSPVTLSNFTFSSTEFGFLNVASSWTEGVYPGVGGNCGGSLAANSTCSIVLAYEPSATGIAEAYVDFDFDDGNGIEPSGAQLFGSAWTSTAGLLFTPDAYVMFGLVGTGTTAERSLTLHNFGASPATGISMSITGTSFVFKGGSYPGTGGTCGTSLSSGTDCQVMLEYSPTVDGFDAESLVVNYGGSFTVAISLYGESSSVYLSNFNFNTNNATPSTSYSTVVTLHNGSGSAVTNLTYQASSNPNFITVTPLTCVFNSGASLAANSSCTFQVAAMSPATGSNNGNIQIGYEDGSGPMNLYMSVSATVSGGGGTLSFAEDGQSPTSSFNFGAISPSSTQTLMFRVTNTGGSAITIQAPTFTGPFGYDTTSGSTCSFPHNLSGSSYCTFRISYNSPSSGSSGGNMSMNHSNGSLNISLSGSAAASGAPLQTISGNIYDLPSVTAGSQAIVEILISNPGGTPADFLSLGSTGSLIQFVGGSFPGSGISGTPCPDPIPANTASCSIRVALQVSNPGLVTSLASFNYDNGSAQVLNFEMFSQGKDLGRAMLVFDRAYYDFGHVEDSQQRELNIRVKNVSGYDATFDSAPTNPGLGFGFFDMAFPGLGGDCGRVVKAGANCTMQVTYTGSNANPLRSNNLVLAYSGNGTGFVAEAFLRARTGSGGWQIMAEAPDYFFKDQPQGVQVTKALTFLNNSDQAVTSISPVVSGNTSEFAHVSSTCGGGVAPYSSCKLTVSYTPSSAAVSSPATYTINYVVNSANYSLFVDLFGNGVPTVPPLVFRDGTNTNLLLAEELIAGSYVDITINNTTGSSINIGPQPFGDPAISLDNGVGTCLGISWNLGAGSNCTARVLFSGPISNRTYSAGFKFGPLSQRFKAVNGVPTGGHFNVGPFYDFGIVPGGRNITKMVTFINDTGATISSVYYSGGAGNIFLDVFNQSPAWCLNNGTLVNGATCTFPVTFYAPAFGGTFHNEITVSWSGGSSKVVFAGSVEDGANLILYPAFVDFGTTPTASRLVKVTNTAPVAMSAASFSGISGQYSKINDNCSTISSNASCTFDVQFTQSSTGTTYTNYWFANGNLVNLIMSAISQ